QPQLQVQPAYALAVTANDAMVTNAVAASFLAIDLLHVVSLHVRAVMGSGEVVDRPDKIVRRAAR
ncbi:MAG: hypothetical protein AAFO79_12370, partial [Pseudomonadota bacterium]